MTQINSHSFNFGKLPFYQIKPPLENNHHQDFFQFAIEAAADGVFLMQPDSRIVYVNQRACDRLDYPPQELLGKHVWEWDPLFPQQTWPGFWAELVDKKHLHFETRHKTRSGDIFPVEITAHYYHNPDGEFVLAFVNDISQKKEAAKELEAAVAQRTEELSTSQKQLQLANQRITVAVNSAQIGIWEYILATNELIWDEWMYKIYDIHETSFSQTYPAWRDALLDEDRDMVENQFLQSIESKQAYSSIFRIRRTDGKIRWIQAHAHVVLTADGEVDRVIGTNIDITRQMQLNERLQSLATQADQANQAKTDFLANMSHEIRTPMNGIIGMVNLILEDPLPAEQYRRMLSVKDSTEALMHIINDILDFSKVESGKLSLDKHPFDLSLIIRQVAANMANKAADKSIEFICPSAPLLFRYFVGDAGRIRQVLSNLVGNALKFTEQGEVSVNLSIQKQMQNSLCLKFEVSDTGPGLKSRDTKRVFERFTQEDSNTTRQFGGTGLGLAISKQLVELMGGEIGVQSTYAKGSTFWFTLTLELDQEKTADNGRFHRSPKFKQQRILVVDDNLHVRQLISQSLSLWGIDNEAVDNGSTALNTLQTALRHKQPFSSVIIDKNMPGMNGFELARKIQLNPQLSSIKLLLLYPVNEHNNLSQHYSSLGFTHITSKPVCPSALYNTILTLSGDPLANTDHTPKPRHTPHFAAHILLAEDNLTNQEVAIGLLDKFKLRVSLAKNGQEAVEMCRQQDFDLVFMDCNMPLMDGYAATRQIRQDSAGKKHLPVIAMTANAMQRDIENSLANGMDAHISKPVTRELLEDILYRWLSHKRSPEGYIEQTTAAQKTNVTLTTDKIFNPAAFIVNMSNDPQLAQTVAQTLVVDVSRLIQQLRQYRENKDFLKIKLTAHAIKGAARSITAIRLAEQAAVIEHIATTENDTHLAQALIQLESDFDIITQRINSFCNELKENNEKNTGYR